MPDRRTLRSVWRKSKGMDEHNKIINVLFLLACNLSSIETGPNSEQSRPRKRPKSSLPRAVSLCQTRTTNLSQPAVIPETGNISSFSKLVTDPQAVTNVILHDTKLPDVRQTM